MTNDRDDIPNKTTLFAISDLFALAMRLRSTMEYGRNMVVAIIVQPLLTASCSY